MPGTGKQSKVNRMHGSVNNVVNIALGVITAYAVTAGPMAVPGLAYQREVDECATVVIRSAVIEQGYLVADVISGGPRLFLDLIDEDLSRDWRTGAIDPLWQEVGWTRANRTRIFSDAAYNGGYIARLCYRPGRMLGAFNDDALTVITLRPAGQLGMLVTHNSSNE